MSRNGVGDLVVDHPHHLLGRDAVGGQRGDERAGARADVDVELVDRAVDRQQVERAQRADLVDGAGEAAAAQHQRGLRLARAPARLAPGAVLRARFRAGVSSFTTLPMRALSLGNDPVGTASSDFRGAAGSVPSVPRSMAPDRRSRLPAARAPARRRLRGRAGRDGPGAGRADAPRGRGVGRAGGRSRHGRARSTPCAPGRRGCPPRWRSSTRRPPRCGGWAPRRGCRPSVLADANPDADGVIDGDLYLRGSGDPTFAPRGVNALARELDDAGIEAVTGRRGRRRERLRRPSRRALLGLRAHV